MNYSLDSHLQAVYCRFPEGRRRAVIGITTNHQDIDSTLRDRYYKQIADAGATPVLIPPVADTDVILGTLDHIDALLLTGGGDIDPRWMGEEPSELLGTVNEERDLPELLICRLAANRQMPMLGICRGMQTMAIALGAHVAQDLSLISERDHSLGISHNQKQERDVRTHTARISPYSTLHSIYGEDLLAVNSFHHQAVDSCGELFKPVAWSDDDVIEAMESTEHKPWMGVQWHPEWLGDDGAPLFRWLVGEAVIYRKVHEMHQEFITLDSHCDTPMFFPQGADFTKRDSRILVDIHKMTDGCLDAATMVAYVPQPVGNQEWKDVMPMPSESPKAYADLIFDRIEAQVASSHGAISIARTPNDVATNKLMGRKTIMLGIENALAIGDDISNVEHFKNRGAVYFTLCHNGDNQVCDSARKSENTWGGLSPFGHELIEEMNRKGIMVDLSHAGERSFYDALEASKKPVVCSHSNCMAICNHERNLSDHQLQALARKDGVCQITLYEGFVSNNPKEADIIRAIEHLDHAVRVMGIEHVGLGSDFDGDGGIPGLKDASELTLFTRQLLLRRYSYSDIRLIWGQNWLRTMAKNQT